MIEIAEHARKRNVDHFTVIQHPQLDMRQLKLHIAFPELEKTPSPESESDSEKTQEGFKSDALRAQQENTQKVCDELNKILKEKDYPESHINAYPGALTSFGFLDTWDVIISPYTYPGVKAVDKIKKALLKVGIREVNPSEFMASSIGDIAATGQKTTVELGGSDAVEKHIKKILDDGEE